MSDTHVTEKKTGETKYEGYANKVEVTGDAAVIHWSDGARRIVSLKDYDIKTTTKVETKG